MAIGVKFDFIEIPAADLDRAAVFYGKLFEAQLEPVELMPGIRSVFLPMPEDSPTGTGAALMEGPAHVPSGYNGPRVYFHAEPDMEAFLARVEEAGGRVEMPSMKVGAGREEALLALFFDTEGNLLGAHSPL